MFDEDDDFYYYDDIEDYDGPCQCSDCRAYRAYSQGFWAGYYAAIDDMEEGLP